MPAAPKNFPVAPSAARRIRRTRAVWRAGVAVLLGLAASVVPAAESDLLRRAAGNWLDERDNWAFTQFAREFDGGKLKRERLERYDPSRPDRERWELLRLDGREPTAEEKADLTERKNRKRRRHTTPVTDYFDFARAVVVDENARTVRYALPLRSRSNWLFPVEKVSLALTVDKATQAITQVQAKIDEPFRVALGLARILDIDLDVRTELPPENPGVDAPHPADPAGAKPNGTARVVVTKFGDRVEYEWSNFQRVEPHPDRKAAQ